MNKIIARLRRSIFAKMLIIFFFLYILLTVFQTLSHRALFRYQHLQKLHKNLVNYSHYIINDIGFPPDTLKAISLAEKMNIELQFRTHEFHWQSATNMPSFEDVSIPYYKESKNIRAGFDDGLFVDIVQNGSRYLILFENPNEGFRYLVETHLVIVLAFITVLVFLMYIIMRWQLEPIRSLHEGVSQLSGSNLDIRIDTNRVDEFGQLIRSFNQMISRIKTMIHARDQLLLDVSHELRSPLTRMKIALEFIEDNDDKDNISQNLYKMETMISEILETERLNSPHGGLEQQSCDIIDLIRQVAPEFSARQPGIKFINLPERLKISIDPERIRILLRNILDNALKYSDINGNPVEISLRETSDELTIEIQDFGQGIPETDLPYIFEPFYRVDKSRSQKTGGYGLGMSMSKKIMEVHDGDLQISSKPGAGTTVYLMFKK